MLYRVISLNSLLIMIYFACGILLFVPYSANAMADEVIKVCNKAVPNGAAAMVQRPTITGCSDSNSACFAIFTLNTPDVTLRDQLNP
ncbi:unnamed protein product [Dracunculus medinensis]|uniref:Secreted protein n=1 Tax=Dracunculus medinensis TaxID=318479 RepID=A0A0N4UBA6_DRAME|nr:unnamed protein product [Dracunculus medinensis]